MSRTHHLFPNCRTINSLEVFKQVQIKAARARTVCPLALFPKINSPASTFHVLF